MRASQADLSRAQATAIETPQQRSAREAYNINLTKARTPEEIDNLIASTDVLRSNKLLTDSQAKKNIELLGLQKRTMVANIAATKAGTIDTIMQAMIRGESIDIEKAKLTIAQNESPTKIKLMKANAEDAVASGKLKKATGDQIVKTADARLAEIEASTGLKKATAAGVETAEEKYKRAIDVANINAKASMIAAGRKFREADLKTIRSQVLKLEGVSDFAGLASDVRDRVTDTTTLATSLFASIETTADQAVATARATMINSYIALGRLTADAAISDLSPIISSGVDTSVVLRKLVELGLDQDASNRLIDATISSIRNANQ